MGVQGPQGKRGCTGEPGCDGRNGKRGFQGFIGFQGDDGPQGPEGVQGAEGMQGFQGDRGFQGDFGPQGMEGAQGFQGFQGDLGVQGIPGPQGGLDNTGSVDDGVISADNVSAPDDFDVTWNQQPSGEVMLGFSGNVGRAATLTIPASQVALTFQMPTSPPPGIVGDYSGSQKTGGGTIMQTSGAAPRNIGGLTGIIISLSGQITLTFTMVQDMVTSDAGPEAFNVGVLVMLTPQ